MKNKETPAKIIVAVLALIVVVLLVVLCICVKRVDFSKVKDDVVNKVAEVNDDTSNTDEGRPYNREEQSTVEEPDISTDEDYDLNEYLSTEGGDVPGAPDRIEASIGTLIPDEKFFLYDMSDYGENLVMYSNKPNYYWTGDNDWAAFLYVDYDANSNAANYDEEADNVTIDSATVLDHDVVVYIYEAEDCITVVTALYDDVILEVQNYDATDIETALSNFKEAANISLVIE